MEQNTRSLKVSRQAKKKKGRNTEEGVSTAIKTKKKKMEQLHVLRSKYSQTNRNKSHRLIGLLASNPPQHSTSLHYSLLSSSKTCNARKNAFGILRSGYLWWKYVESALGEVAWPSCSKISIKPRIITEISHSGSLSHRSKLRGKERNMGKYYFSWKQWNLSFPEKSWHFFVSVSPLPFECGCLLMSYDKTEVDAKKVHWTPNVYGCQSKCCRGPPCWTNSPSLLCRDQ